LDIGFLSRQYVVDNFSFMTLLYVSSLIDILLLLPDDGEKCINTGILDKPLEIDGAVQLQSDYHQMDEAWIQAVGELVSESLTTTCKNKETCTGTTCSFQLEKCTDIVTCEDPNITSVSRQCDLMTKCYERNGTNKQFVMKKVCPGGQKFDLSRRICVNKIKKGKNCSSKKYSRAL